MSEDLQVGHTHADTTGGWLRPTVFGAMDGLVSNLALIAGVAGGVDDPHTVAVAGLAGLVAGAFSMATGEYVSVQSQNESTRAEVAVERRELETNFAGELDELAGMFVDRGVDPELARTVARQLSRDPEQTLEIHALAELGVDPGNLPSPWLAAISSFLAFTAGALVPLLPYLFGASTVTLSLVLALAALFGAGAATSRFTERTWLFAGTRQLALGALAAAVTYGVGHLFGTSVG